MENDIYKLLESIDDSVDLESLEQKAIKLFRENNIPFDMTAQGKIKVPYEFRNLAKSVLKINGIIPYKGYEKSYSDLNKKGYHQVYYVFPKFYTAETQEKEENIIEKDINEIQKSINHRGDISRNSSSIKFTIYRNALAKEKGWVRENAESDELWEAVDMNMPEFIEQLNSKLQHGKVTWRQYLKFYYGYYIDIIYRFKV